MTSEQRNGAAQYIQRLVDDLKSAQLRIKELENEIEQQKAKKTELEQVTIPDYMTEVNIRAIKLFSGSEVTVKPFYYARVPKNPDEFFDWLRSNNHGGLIKNKFEVIPTTDEAAEYIEYFLSHEIGNCYERSKSIHWKTLEAWFKEQCELHNPLPLDKFDNFIGRKATVK